MSRLSRPFIDMLGMEHIKVHSKVLFYKYFGGLVALASDVDAGSKHVG